MHNIGFEKVSEGEDEYTPSAMGVYIAIGHALGSANYRGLIVKIILFGGTDYPANTNRMATLIEATAAGNSSITYDTTTGKITYSSSFAHSMDVYKMGVR